MTARFHTRNYTTLTDAIWKVCLAIRGRKKGIAVPISAYS